MVKPELGTKRVCVACGARFYDLTKSPAVTIKQPRYRAFVASLRACEERFDGLGLELGLDFLFHLGLPLYQGDLRRHVDRTQADGANPTS